MVLARLRAKWVWVLVLVLDSVLGWAQASVFGSELLLAEVPEWMSLHTGSSVLVSKESPYPSLQRGRR
jgi:hypothetical protein